MTLLVTVVVLVVLGLFSAVISRILECISYSGIYNLFNQVRWALEIVLWTLFYLVAIVPVLIIGAWWEGLIALVWFGFAAGCIATEWFEHRREIARVLKKAWMRRGDLRSWL